MTYYLFSIFVCRLTTPSYGNNLQNRMVMQTIKLFGWLLQEIGYWAEGLLHQY